MAVGRRLGAGLLRLGGFALSCLAYSYLELLDIRGQQGPNATGSGGRLSSLIVETLGEYAPAAAAKWGEGAAAVPPILKRCVVWYVCVGMGGIDVARRPI